MKTEVKYLGNTKGELFTSWHYVPSLPCTSLVARVILLSRDLFESQRSQIEEETDSLRAKMGDRFRDLARGIHVTSLIPVTPR